MLAVVVPDASASAFRRPSLLGDARHSAAAETHGFLLGRSSFPFKMSSAVSTTDAGRPALAAGLYVVLNENHLSTPTEGPLGDVLQAETSETGSNDKNKNPPPRRREKHDKKRKNT